MVANLDLQKSFRLAILVIPDSTILILNNHDCKKAVVRGCQSISGGSIFVEESEFMKKNNNGTLKIVYTGLTAALSFVVFYFLQFKIFLPGGDATSIHLGNAVCVLGALLLGGAWGGLGGAIGMTIGDLIDPIYIIYAPKTFILKFCIGLITGFVAHGLGNISTETDSKKVAKWTIAASAAGLVFNVIFDPLFGYFYKRVLLGKPAAEVTLAWNVAASAINAGLSIVVASVVYMALRPALKKSGMFFIIDKKGHNIGLESSNAVAVQNQAADAETQN